IRCKAARRAERGPSPGTLARSWISRSISGPAIRLDMEPSHAVRKGTGGLKAALLNQEIGSCQSERQLETGGNRQSCRHLLGLALHLGLDLYAGIIMRSEDKVFEDLGLFGLQKRRIDGELAHLELAGERHLDSTSGR